MSRDERLERRLRCLVQAEANALQKAFESSLPDRAHFERDLYEARKWLER